MDKFENLKMNGFGDLKIGEGAWLMKN